MYTTNGYTALFCKASAYTAQVIHNYNIIDVVRPIATLDQKLILRDHFYQKTFPQLVT